MEHFAGSRLLAAGCRALGPAMMIGACGSWGWVSAAEPEAAPVLLHVSLSDGSSILGKPGEGASVKIDTSRASFEIPWVRIRAVERLADEGRLALAFHNGDLIKGKIEPLHLDSLLGQIVVQSRDIRKITIRRPGLLPEEGLVLRYSFDQIDEGQVVKDSSGEGNHAVNAGATIAPKGVIGPGARMDGQSARLNVKAGGLSDLPSWDDYTLSVWFLNDGDGDHQRGYGQKIIDKTVMYHDFYLCVRATGALGFFTYEGSGAGLQDDAHDYRDGKWHHAVVTKKGSHGELWIDGELKDSTEDLKAVDSDGPLVVGYSDSGDRLQRKHWSGMLDELLIYDRAISRDEIQDLFQMKE